MCLLNFNENKEMYIHEEFSNMGLTESDVRKRKELAREIFLNRKLPICRYPANSEVTEWADGLIELMFQQFSERVYYSPEEIDAEVILSQRKLIRILSPVCTADPSDSEQKAVEFYKNLPAIYDHLKLDSQALESGDPAAGSVDEVILTYPGFYGIAIFRIAHKLFEIGIPLYPRLLTEYAHRLTGIDIHPGARIGKSFCMDHGTGIVIGETTIIGDNVKIYQGVTLGGLSVEKQMAKKKRHPTIGDNVVIYAGATILGGETVVGRNSIIGGNTWLTSSVPPNSVVYNKSQVRVKTAEEQHDEVINFVI